MCQEDKAQRHHSSYLHIASAPCRASCSRIAETGDNAFSDAVEETPAYGRISIMNSLRSELRSTYSDSELSFEGLRDLVCRILRRRTARS